MKITYIITGLGLGGAEVITIGIANQMVDRGHKVMLMYLSEPNECQSFIDSRVCVVGLNMNKSLMGFVNALYKAKTIISQFSPNVVHSQMFHSNMFARTLRLICKVPILINTEHSKNIESNFRMKLYCWSNWLSDINTNVSQEAVDYFIAKGAFNAKNSFCIYNGIDLSRFSYDKNRGLKIRELYNVGQDEFLYINVGRLTEAKDQINLITAFSQLNVGKLMIVGKGELQETLQCKINEFGLSDRVVLAGAHSNIEDYYSAANCFVLSSRWEGFGIVIAEAMACGLPAISTDAGGCAEVISDNNYIVPVNNATLLAEKMDAIYQMSPQQRSELGDRNKQLASRFDIKTICDKWIEAYNYLN